MSTMKNTMLLFVCLMLFFACSREEATYRIGVSQCSDDEWREQMNKEICREALFYPGTEIEIRAAKDNSKRQVADIRHFVDAKVDLLIISPNEADVVAPAIEEAFDKGIPVVLVDRKIHSGKYTAYIGADNYDIGRRAGSYIADRLHGKGQVVEITGLAGSTPAVERSRGMRDALSLVPGIAVISSVDAGWFHDAAEHVFDSILSCHRQIDLVFAQNDRMAIGAYHAAARHHCEKDILFVGVDAMSGKGFGLEDVADGKLEASFIYPTGGDRVMQVAMAILQGKPYERETRLSTALVDRSNVRIMRMQRSHIADLDKKIEFLHGKLDVYLLRYSSQRVLLFACIIILVLLAVLLFFAVRAFWARVRMNAVLSGQKQELEQQRDRLVDLSRQLDEATRAKLSFFTAVSHDFRTPLALIADPVDQLVHNKKLDEAERRSLLDIIQKNVKVLLRLVHQVLDFRKYESGRLEMHCSAFDVAAKLQEWCEAFRALAFQKHIRFHLDIADAPDGCRMVADEEKMERIVYNLLSNSFKFTRENGAVSLSLSCCEREGKPFLHLSVSDTGVGISKEDLQHVFDEFYQGSVHFTGSGLGLALVKAFVKMHHGTISVESEVGRGTTFSVVLPMTQEVSHETVPEKSQKLCNLEEGALISAGQESADVLQRRKHGSRDRSVLVIDDNKDIRDYLCMSLGKEYAVLEASNGMEGVKMAMKYLPDAVICDVMMPVMDGMACCRRLKSEKQTAHIPVIMLTAYDREEEKVKAYECGADSYLSKPFSMQLLLARLDNLIGKEQSQGSAGSLKMAGQSVKESLEGADKDFMDRLYKLVDNNILVSVEELGQQIGLSRVQLFRKVKKLTGHSPNEWLRIIRLERAAFLLASTDKTISEVSYSVGFASSSYFAKCYKEYFGENPADFLKRKPQ